MPLIEQDLDLNGKMLLGSQQSYTLPAQGTRMRLFTIADHTLCRVYLETSENSYHQPIVLDIFYRAQYDTSKPQIVRSESYEWHAHSNDVIFTSDQAGTAGASTHIYAEKVAHGTGRPLNIRKIEVFDGTVTILDGSTTDTNGGTDESVISTFAELNLGDSDKLSIGDNNDLQIYHDGSNSYIKEVGNGTLRLQTNGGGIDLYKDSTEFLARFITDGAAELYYDSVKKLATKSDGVDITGELQADSLDIDGNADISGSLNLGGDVTIINSIIHTGDPDTYFGFHDNDQWRVVTGGTERLEVKTDLITSTLKIIAPKLSIQNQINTTSANLEFNYENGDGTTSNFKDFYVRDGKNANILRITGSDKKALFEGEVEAASLDINGNADISGNLSGVDTLTASALQLPAANDITFSNTANDQYRMLNTETKINAMPFPLDFHDLLSFGGSYTITQEISTDGTNFSSMTLESGVFDLRTDEAVRVIDGSLSTEEQATRYTFTNVAYNAAQFVKICFTYTSSAANVVVTVDTSNDGFSSNSTQRHQSTFTSASATTGYFYIPYHGGDTHMRITLDKGNNTDNKNVNVSSIQLLTRRHGDQGNGPEYNVPYQWDYDKNITLYGDLDFSDNKKIKLGNSDDLQLYHNGTNNYIDSSTGHLYIRNTAQDKDIVIQGNDGGSTVTALEFDMSAGAAATFAGDVTIGDDLLVPKIRLEDINGTVGSLFKIYAWDDELQFTKRNLSTEAYEGTLLSLNYSDNSATFAGSLTIPDYINHAGDSGTKFGFDGDDTFTVRTGGAVRLTVTDTDVTTAQNFTSSGYVQAFGLLYLRDSVKVLNKATDGWLNLAARDTSGSEAVYNLDNIGTIISGDITAGNLIPSADGTKDLGNSSNRWRNLELKSGGQIQWQNGDARIIEGAVNNYSLSFQTYSTGTSSLSTALRLEGDNTATFSGSLNVGQVITLDHDRFRGQKFTITKINRTKCHIEGQGGHFNVPMSMVIA